jgi:tetratricopeptide (TPR) repeat protein
MSQTEEIAIWIKANQLYKQGFTSQSLSYFERISHLSKIAFNMGCIYLQQKDYDSAVLYLTKAILIDAYFSLAHFQRGFAYFMLGDYEGAKLDYTTSLNVSFFKKEL